MNLWIVGKFVGEVAGESSAWEFCGVFDSEDKAKAQCHERAYFYGPSVLNKEIPKDKIEWDGLVYPLA